MGSLSGCFLGLPGDKRCYSASPYTLLSALGRPQGGRCMSGRDPLGRLYQPRAEGKHDTEGKADVGEHIRSGCVAESRESPQGPDIFSLRYDCSFS